jgi:hypothetical protein
MAQISDEIKKQIEDRINENYFPNGKPYISNHLDERKRCEEDILFGLSLASQGWVSELEKWVNEQRQAAQQKYSQMTDSEIVYQRVLDKIQELKPSPNQSIQSQEK